MTVKATTTAEPRSANSASPTRLSNTRSNHIHDPTSAFTTGLVSDAPMLSASASTDKSPFTLGRNGETDHTNNSSASFEFLPSVSFDDLHTSIESASTEFKLTQFPSPPIEGNAALEKPMVDRTMQDKASTTQNGTARAINPPISNRNTRSGSILRRPSTSSRQPSISSVASSTSGPIDATNAPVAMRTRRQSQYPPVSNTGSLGKAPRKSIGPGVVGDSDSVVRVAQRRRPSLLGERISSESTRQTFVDSSSLTISDAKPNTRAAKAKSVQPPPRPSQAGLTAGSTLTPEQNRLSTLAPRSPRAGAKGSTPSSNNKRASMMPGTHNGSHATGLGARTISPTDTRRMRRMSTMPQSQSLTQVVNIPPPPPVSMDARAQSRSPSMIPRKTADTPTSARTTPDVNRKSHGSGPSVSSAININVMRASMGSAQQRLPPPSVASRLPGPKHTTTHSTVSSDEQEDVPPVPAIPKAYESPKESNVDTYFTEKKKTALAASDATSIHSNSTGSISMPVLPEPIKIQHKPAIRKSSYATSSNTENENSNIGNKRHLEPLSLPPLNLGPLRLPTSKVSSNLKDLGNSDRDLSPSLSRPLPKTPTTPMTASKSSFFSKGGYDETIELPSLRSSTSVNHTRNLSPSPPGISSSDSSLALKDVDHKSSISPFLSSSLPKNGFDHGYLKRSKTGGDNPTVTGLVFEDKISLKPAGPRAQKSEKPVPKSPPPSENNTEEPPTPSSMSSLRRKLSMSWKRGNTKNNASQDGADKSNVQQTTGHDTSMPPPRLPASATASSLSSAKQQSPSPAINGNGGYLETRRRKSSAASLTNHNVQDRSRSDTWSVKKPDVTSSNTVPVTRISTASKLLKPKSSSAALRSASSWAVELDKDDKIAEDEMRKLGSRRKETDLAARTLDALKKRATAKERVSCQEAIRIAMLNTYERGEIIDYEDVYFCGTQNARKVVGDLQSDAPNFGYDDERGDYSIVPGDHLSYRYEIIDILGKGSFGQVVRCIDHKLGVLVAVKIIRNKKRFHQQAIVEVNILKKLREWDPKNRHSMINFTQSFYFRGHLCISTELLDMNLYEFIKAHSFRGFSLRIVRRFTKQILSSLILLKQHKIIHCDLKPENILLCHPLQSGLRVIDFGSSCFENEKVYTYIQSRFYRSPEVILGMTYGMPIDMWSVGCILAELYTGVPIFPGENEQEQLACIMEVFGPPEKHLIEKSTRKKLFFDSMGKPRLTVSSKGRRRRPSSKTLQQALKCDDEAFVDFLARCLRWDPDRRLRPEDAMRHEFITGQKMVPAASRVPTRETSPVKRNNTTTLPRPLPDPPGGNVKGNTVTRTGVSPHKPSVSSSSRRVSGATAATTASINRRTSAGPTMISSGASGLPRAAGRSVSGKQDLAAAGATAAMYRRV